MLECALNVQKCPELGFSNTHHMGKQVSDIFTKNILMESAWNVQMYTQNFIFVNPYSS